MAEWSKALVLGTSLKGRGFESHHCQGGFEKILRVPRDQKSLETPGIEPGTSHMRSERSTTELHPHNVISIFNILCYMQGWPSGLRREI